MTRTRPKTVEPELSRFADAPAAGPGRCTWSFRKWEARMAVHEVDITLPKREIGRADAIFDVKADGVTLGALHVSRGAVVWFPSGTT